jgi:peptidoglycan/LPS O-acetylase OafA/YrhL
MSPTAIDPKASRLPSLTGIRFLAAFLVFICHVSLQKFFQSAATNNALIHVGLDFGWLGVEFFFILSGFVLTWSARPHDTPRRFWRRRLTKIYPNHFASWAVAIVLALVAGTAVTVPKMMPSLFLVHAWFPNNEVLSSINLPSWSLSCELLFYLSFPWLLHWVRKIPEERLWLSVGAVFAAIIALAVIATLAFPSTPHLSPFNMGFTQHWFVYQFPPARVLDFLLGIIMARIVITGRWIPMSLLAASMFLVAGCVVQHLLALTVYATTVPIVLPLALVIAAGAVGDVHGQASPFRAKTVIWLGEVSFALYMIHYLVLQFGHIALGGVHRTWAPTIVIGIALLLLGVSLAAAWLMYTFVEEPAMRHWSRPRIHPDQAATSRPPPVLEPREDTAPWPENRRHLASGRRH